MGSTFKILAIAIIGLSCPIKAALVDARYDHACYCPSAANPNVIDERTTALRCAAIQHGVGDQKNAIDGKLLYHLTEIKFGYVGASPTRGGFLDASLTRKEKLACIRRFPTTQDFSKLDALFVAQGGCATIPNNTTAADSSEVVKPICQRFQGPITGHAWKRVSLDPKPLKETHTKDPQHITQLKAELKSLLQRRKEINDKMSNLKSQNERDLAKRTNMSKKEIEQHDASLYIWPNRPEHWKPLLHKINQEIKQVQNEMTKEEAKPEANQDVHK